jgi:hypothetical protein
MIRLQPTALHAILLRQRLIASGESLDEHGYPEAAHAVPIEEWEYVCRLFFGLHRWRVTMAYAPVDSRYGVQRTFTLDKEADEILLAMGGGPKIRGHYISRLILIEKARQEERQRQAEATCKVCGEHKS